MLDRIDICVEAPPVRYEELTMERRGEGSRAIRQRVSRAQAIQQERYRNTRFRFNADLDMEAVKRFCRLDGAQQKLMQETYERLELTARAYCRILKVARTIADLDEAERIGEEHLSEAICYRALDKKYWNGAER